jgi:hypothetical protein
MNSMARNVDADRDDLPGDLTSLYELTRRSTSAECGLAAKSRASATLNAFQHSVLQTYWYKSLERCFADAIMLYWRHGHSVK